MTRLIYHSERGGKPLNVGMNHAKRVARAADRRDTRTVQREFGPGFPKQIANHQQLVKHRHAYYHDQYAARAGADNSDTGDTGGAVPEPAAGADPQ